MYTKPTKYKYRGHRFDNGSTLYQYDDTQRISNDMLINTPNSILANQQQNSIVLPNNYQNVFTQNNTSLPTNTGIDKPADNSGNNSNWFTQGMDAVNQVSPYFYITNTANQWGANAAQRASKGKGLWTNLYNSTVNDAVKNGATSEAAAKAGSEAVASKAGSIAGGAATAIQGITEAYQGWNQDLSGDPFSREDARMAVWNTASDNPLLYNPNVSAWSNLANNYKDYVDSLDKVGFNSNTQSMRSLGREWENQKMIDLNKSDLDKSIGRQILDYNVATGKGALIGLAAGGPWGALAGAIVGSGLDLFNKYKANKNKDKILNAAKEADQRMYQQALNRRDIITEMNNRRDMINYSALGGKLFDQGGTMLNKFETGGSHEENPYGGILQGIAPDGEPNLVEQGETKWNDENYIFSKRLKINRQLAKEYNLPKEFIGKSFADATSKFDDKFNEHENDALSIATQNAILTRTSEAQEALRANEMMKQLNEQMANLTPEEQQNLLIQMQQQPMETQQMQYPMGSETMQGGMPQGYALGGNMFDGEPDLAALLEQAAQAMRNQDPWDSIRVVPQRIMPLPIDTGKAIYMPNPLPLPNTIEKPIPNSIKKPWSSADTSKATYMPYPLIWRPPSQEAIEQWENLKQTDPEAYDYYTGRDMSYKPKYHLQGDYKHMTLYENGGHLFSGEDLLKQYIKDQYPVDTDEAVNQWLAKITANPEQYETSLKKYLENRGYVLDPEISLWQNVNVLGTSNQVDKFNTETEWSKNYKNRQVIRNKTGETPQPETIHNTAFQSTISDVFVQKVQDIKNSDKSVAEKRKEIKKLADEWNEYNKLYSELYTISTDKKETDPAVQKKVKEMQTKFDEWGLNKGLTEQIQKELKTVTSKSNTPAYQDNPTDGVYGERTNARYLDARTQELLDEFNSVGIRVTPWDNDVNALHDYLTPEVTTKYQTLNPDYNPADVNSPKYIDIDIPKEIADNPDRIKDYLTQQGYVSSGSDSTIPEDVFYYTKDSKNKPTDEKVADTTTNLLPTWMRGVGAVLPFAFLNAKSDYSNADMIRAPKIGFNPIADYLRYRPLDKQYYLNTANASQQNLRNNIVNLSGGNRAAAMNNLMIADLQAQNALGDLYRRAEEYNADQRAKVAAQNADVNKFNSNGFFGADQWNANAEFQARQAQAQMRHNIDVMTAQAKGANLTQGINNLIGIGNENARLNMIASNPALVAYYDRNFGVNYKGPKTEKEESTKKCGGYLTIKKRK